MIQRRQIIGDASAATEFDHLPFDIQEQIDEALARLVLRGHGDLRHLKGLPGHQWRLRVGDYRVRFSLRNGDLVVLYVRHRGQAYRD